MPKSSLSPLALALSTALLVSGCALGPDFLRPASTLPEQYHDLPAATAEDEVQAPLNPEWWKLFADPKLDALVAEALAQNQDLLAAVARLEAAMAAADEAGAERFPAVDLSGSSLRSRSSGETASGQRMGAMTSTNRRVALGIQYELDLWGRIRRSTEAARAEALASQFARDALKLSLTAQVVDTYLGLLSLDAQLKATGETLASREQTLNIVKARVDAGAASALDLTQAQGALAAARAQWNELRRQRGIAETQLALLTGKPDLRLPPGDLQRLPTPPLPPVGLPSSLLEARPDVRQAEAQLVAANARIGIAKSAFFPSISLTGLFGSESAALAQLFTNGASIWSYGAALALPIFNAGRTTARVEQASASQKEAVARYQKTVQTAFKEVSDALINLKEYDAAEAALATQLETAEQAYKLAQARYEAGYTSFLEVLDSQRSLNSAQLSFLATRKHRLSATVDLFKALGGGWQPEQAE